MNTWDVSHDIDALNTMEMVRVYRSSVEDNGIHRRNIQYHVVINTCRLYPIDIVGFHLMQVPMKKSSVHINVR